MKSVLIVDDNGKGMKEALDLLRERGYSVTERSVESEELARFTQFAVDHAHVQVFWTSPPPEYRILYANEAACRSLGYTNAELTRMSCLDIDPTLKKDRRLLDYLQTLDRKTKLVRFETVHQARDGRLYPVEIFLTDVTYEGREYGLTFVTDITERKKAEEELLLSQFCIEKATAAIFRTTLDGRILMVNEAACRSLGYSQEELLTMTAFDVNPVICSEKVAEYAYTVGRLGNLTIETFHRRKDGTIFPVEVTINKLDFHGEAYLFIFANDITERRKNERELHLTKFFMDKAPIMIFRGHKDGRVLYANEHAAKVLGYTMEELSSMTFFDIVPGLGEQRWKKHRLELRDKGLRKFEAVHRCRDGARIPVEVTVGYLKFEDEEFSCAFSHDFSDRKKAEESLRESEKKFRMLTETSPNGIVVVDRARIVYANKAATRISGFSSDELLGRGLWDFVKQDYSRIRKNKTTTEVPPSRSESRLVTRDGRERWVMATRASMEYEGKPATLVTLIDITEAKHAEEALRESEARLKVAMELAGLVPWELDVLSGVFHFNEQFYKLYGTSSDIEGSFLMPAARYMNGFVHPEDIQEVEKAIESTLQGRDTETGHHMEHRIIRADGEERWISVRWDNIYDKDGRLAKTVGANQDTTVQHQAEEERKSLETQLHQAQKMEAIGQLAGGVAHDFNNILTAMIGFAELISMKLDRESPLHHYLGQIISAGGRAADLTQGLLAFSRKQVLNVKVLEVHDVIEGFRKMLRRLIPEDIELKINVSPTGMPVMADRGQLEQVLMNLATNARDAMPSGGVLKIEAAPVDLDRETVHGWGFGEPGKYAMVSISDNGCGMDHETMSKIFEPFFTTKPVGKGTGLGLAIIYGIIKQHEGFVTVDSSHGIGSIFNIYLPLTDRKQEEQAITPAMEPKTGGSGTILLAEDDETVRELHTLTLSEAGYRVIAGSDGRDALRRFIAAGARADILVTDVIMPNMDGKSLYEAMCSLHPGMKVLFLSGYSAEILNQRGISEINLMPKPVLPSELMQRVREILTEGVNVPRQSPARQD